MEKAIRTFFRLMEMFCVLNATVFTTGIDSCQQTANSTLKYVFLMISKLYYRQFHLQFFKKNPKGIQKLKIFAWKN